MEFYNTLAGKKSNKGCLNNKENFNTYIGGYGTLCLSSCSSCVANQRGCSNMRTGQYLGLYLNQFIKEVDGDKNIRKMFKGALLSYLDRILDSSDKTRVIWFKTKENHDFLYQYLHQKGIRTSKGNLLIEDAVGWEKYGDQLCFSLSSKAYKIKEYYEDVGAHIIDADDLINTWIQDVKDKTGKDVTVQDVLKDL